MFKRVLGKSFISEKSHRVEIGVKLRASVPQKLLELTFRVQACLGLSVFTLRLCLLFVLAGGYDEQNG